MLNKIKEALARFEQAVLPLNKEVQMQSPKWRKLSETLTGKETEAK